MNIKTNITRILIILLSLAPFILILVYSYLNNWITPFYQSDLAGYVYAMYEKKILHNFIQLYSITYNQPAYSTGYLIQNDLFLVIIPAFSLFFTTNILISVSISKLIVLVLSFISMFASIYYLIRRNIYIALLLGLFYAFSPTFMIFDFMPDLMYSYAILPLVLTPILEFLIFGKLHKKLLALSLILMLGLHPYPLLYAALLIISILVLKLFIFSNYNRLAMKNIIILLLLILILFIKYEITSYWGSPIQAPLNELVYERLSHYGEFSQWSLSNLLELLGGQNVDGPPAYNLYAQYTGIPKMDNYINSYVSVTAIIIWIIIISGLWAQDRRVRHVSIIALYIAVIAWFIHEILLWLLTHTWYAEKLAQVPLVGSALRNFILTLRTPGRIASVLLPFSLVLLGIILDNLVIRRKWRIIISTIFIVFIVIIILLNLFYFNFSSIYTYYKLSERPGWREWPPGTYNNIITDIEDIYGYYNATIIDHSVAEPHYFFLGQQFYFDYNHYSYYTNSKSLPLMLQDLSPVVLINSIDSNNEIENLYENGIGALVYNNNLNNDLTVFLLDKPALRVWVLIPANICRILENSSSISIYFNLTDTVSPYIIESSMLPSILSGLNDINGSSSFAVEAWVKLIDFSKNKNQIILSVGKLWNNNSLAFFYGWRNDFYFSLGNRYTQSISVVVPQWNQVNHIIGIFNNGTLYIYINNKLIYMKKISIEKPQITLNDIIYNEMPDGILLGANVFRIKNLPEPYSIMYHILESNIQNNLLKAKMVLSLKSNYCRNLWLPFNIPIFSGSSGKIQGLNNSFVYASVNIDNTTFFKTYAFVEKTYMPLNNCNKFKPIIIFGGANDISVASDLINDLVKKNNTCLLPIAGVGQTNLAKFNYVKILSLTSLYYNILNTSSIQIIKPYESYTPSSGFSLRGFGLSYYWSLPFLGYIPSGIYGEFTNAPYSLILYPSSSGASLEFKSNDIGSRVGHVIIDITVNGIGNISILLYNNSNIILKRNIYINSSLPLHLFVDAGSIELRGDQTFHFVVNKSPTIMFSLNNIFFTTLDFNHLLSSYNNTGTYVFVIPLLPLVQLVNSSTKYIQINNAYQTTYSSLLMSDVGSLAINPGGSILIPPILVSKATYDIYLHLIPPIPSGVLIKLDVLLNNKSTVFYYNISNSVTHDYWVKVGSLTVSKRSQVGLSISVENGYLYTDAIALVPRNFVSEVNKEPNFTLIKEYLKYAPHNIFINALSTLNGYILLPDYSDSNIRASFILLSKKWLFVSMLFTILNIIENIIVIYLILFFIFNKPSQNKTLLDRMRCRRELSSTALSS